MILKFFKTQQPLAYFALAAIVSVAWIIGFLTSFSVINDDIMPFYRQLLIIITPDNKFIYFLLGFALVASQAIHFNSVINKHEVLYKNSFLPGLFYVLLSCSVPQFISFHPLLIVNSLLIFVMDKIFMLYKNESPLALDFDICLLLSIISLFYLPAAVFIMIYIIGLLILRPFSWRDWIVGIMGLITPVFFVFLYYFLNDQTNEMSVLLFSSGSNINREFNLTKVIPVGYPLLIMWIVIMLLLSFFKLRTNFYKNAAKTRNYQQIVLFLLIIALTMTAFASTQMIYRFSILCIPLSIIIAYYFLAVKKKWITTTLFYSLIGIIIYNYISFI